MHFAASTMESVSIHMCVHHSLKASDLPLSSSTAYYEAICFAQHMRQQTAVNLPWITKQLFQGLYPLLLNIHMCIIHLCQQGVEIVIMFYL